MPFDLKYEDLSEKFAKLFEPKNSIEKYFFSLKNNAENECLKVNNVKRYIEWIIRGTDK